MGHIWPNPVDSKAFMALLCYKNGSVTRERIRDEVAGGNWETFNKLLNRHVHNFQHFQKSSSLESANIRLISVSSIGGRGLHTVDVI